MYSFTHSCLHSLIIHPLISLLIHWLTCSYTYSLFHSFTYSLILSFLVRQEELVVWKLWMNSSNVLWREHPCRGTALLKVEKNGLEHLCPGQQCDWLHLGCPLQGLWFCFWISLSFPIDSWGLGLCTGFPGLFNKSPDSKWQEWWKFVVSQFWRTEVPN
jgi:hypothetical protein